MISGKLKAVVFILVFLLILALTAHWALEMDAKRHPQPDPEPAPEPEPAAAPFVPSDDPGHVMTPDEIAALLASM